MIIENKCVYYAVIAVFLLLTFYCLSSAVNRGVANAWYFNAEFSLNDWAEYKTIKDKTEYDRTLLSITKAHSLDPTHPHYAHMVGRIMHWGVDMGFEDISKLEEIKQWYLLSTTLRPLWPDPWVDLLLLNNYLYGYTDETKFYIQQAISTGPYLNAVTLGTIKVWLLNWQVLSGKERELLFKQFNIATTQYKILNQVVTFAKTIDREKIICSQIKFNKLYLKQKDTYLYRSNCLR